MLLALALAYGIVAARRMLEALVLVGDDDDEDSDVRTGEEEGEGGTDGEGDAEEDAEDEDEEGALARMMERKRGKAPVWFHTRVSSPPSKSSSSEEESASSTSVSPGPIDGLVFADAAAATVLFLGIGRLYVGKMRRGADAGVGSDRCFGEGEGERGRRGSSREGP